MSKTKKKTARETERERVAALRKKAPRQLFVVVGVHGTAISYDPSLGKARAQKQAAAMGAIIVGPYVLAERQRND